MKENQSSVQTSTIRQNKECGTIEGKLTREQHTNIMVTELFEELKAKDRRRFWMTLS